MALAFTEKNMVLIWILWPLRCPQWFHGHHLPQQQPWERLALLRFPLRLPPGPLPLPLLTFLFPQLSVLGLQLLLHQKKWLVQFIQLTPEWEKGSKPDCILDIFNLEHIFPWRKSLHGI